MGVFRNADNANTWLCLGMMLVAWSTYDLKRDKWSLFPMSSPLRAWWGVSIGAYVIIVFVLKATFFSWRKTGFSADYWCSELPQGLCCVGYITVYLSVLDYAFRRSKDEESVRNVAAERKVATHIANAFHLWLIVPPAFVAWVEATRTIVVYAGSQTPYMNAAIYYAWYTVPLLALLTTRVINRWQMRYRIDVKPPFLVITVS